MQYYYDDKEFGRVLINVRHGMRNITARWKEERLHLNAPWGVTQSDVKDALDSMRDRLRTRLSQQPAVSFSIGQEIVCFRCVVRIIEQSRFTDRITFGHDGDTLTLGVPAGSDLATANSKRNITLALQAMLQHEAVRLLLPYAAQTAREIGVAPSRWEIGRGMRKLGHCTRLEPRTIQLSRNLMFLNERLVRYVICHELAHLTHADHSPQFHALVDLYTGGQEKMLEKELKHFEWPIVR